MWKVRTIYGLYWENMDDEQVVDVLEMVGKNYRHLNRMRRHPNKIFETQFHQIKYVEDENVPETV